MYDYVDVTSQAELDRAVADGNIPVCRSGYFEASGNASVRAYGNASVSAYGNASVSAYGDASVRAFDDASVRAYGNASVSAYGNASVSASKYVAIHRHGDTPKVDGGVLIQIPDLTDPANFLEFYGVAVEGRGRRATAVLYKAVDGDFNSHHGTNYTPGTTTTCDDDDWSPENCCGYGLHFSPRPLIAQRYMSAATRFVACRVKVSDIVVIGDHRPDKIKVPACECLHEVDIDGEPLEVAEAAA